jgi:hypothetical protein
MIDFSKVRSGEQTFGDIAATLSKEDLYTLTDEMIDLMRSYIADAVDADVTFQPIDPDANDPYASDSSAVNEAWTLGHVIVHATASSEESAALALQLARGIPVEGRSRYETPWETMKTVDQLVQRLEESRRMRKAMLDAWPDQPNLELSYEPWPGAGQMNAVARFILGLAHDSSHLGQIQEIMRQARAARGA